MVEVRHFGGGGKLARDGVVHWQRWPALGDQLVADVIGVRVGVVVSIGEVSRVELLRVVRSSG